MRLKTSIISKLITYFLLIALFAVVIIGSYSYSRAKHALFQRTFDQLTSLRIEKKYRIEQFFNDRIQDAALLAKSPDTFTVLEILEKEDIPDSSKVRQIKGLYFNVLKVFVQSDPFYHTLHFVSKQSKSVSFAPGETGEISPAVFHRKFPLTDILDSLQLHSVSLLEDFQGNPETQMPVIQLGIQVRAETGVVLGFIVLEIDINSINSIMFENNPHNGLGESGESYLVGSDMTMRSTSRFQDNSVFNTLVNTRGVHEAFNGLTGTDIIDDYRGIPVLSSWGSVDIPGLNWVIMAEIDEEEAMIPIDSIRNNIVFLAIIILLFLFAIVYLIARRISLPIVKLKQAAQRITQGDYKVKVKNIDSQDEIGSLVLAFNEMSSKIEEQKQRLEMERLMRVSSMLDGQELERHRFSRELHDGLGQSILAIKMRLGRLPKASAEKKLEILTEVDELFSKTIHEIRAISNDLAPAVLTEFGLLEALRALCKEIDTNADLSVSFTHDLSGQKPDDKLSTYLYRIAQEALNNVVKHARAQKVSLSLKEQNRQMVLCISDDGRGFSYEDGKKTCGNGLNNIKERVEILKGQITIHSNSAGTRILVQVPLQTNTREL